MANKEIIDHMGNVVGERAGLEGPFRYRSGRVLYYDPVEGSYYDHTNDTYVGVDEVMNEMEPMSNPQMTPKQFLQKYGTYKGETNQTLVSMAEKARKHLDKNEYQGRVDEVAEALGFDMETEAGFDNTYDLLSFLTTYGGAYRFYDGDTTYLVGRDEYVNEFIDTHPFGKPKPRYNIARKNPAITQTDLKKLARNSPGSWEWKRIGNRGEIVAFYIFDQGRAAQYAAIEDTRKSYGNKSGLRYETSDGERWEDLKNAKLHALEFDALPFLRKDGYLADIEAKLTSKKSAKKKATKKKAAKKTGVRSLVSQALK